VPHQRRESAGSGRISWTPWTRQPGAWVWQVAVDAAYRGHGVAAALLDGLTARLGAGHGVASVETTITPGNTASERLFTSYAARHGAPVTREVLFDSGLFPDGPHQPEVLYRIGPLTPHSSH
ncbi:GNAT family N-acetyltransferase, partial [Streptomyces sp. NPDC000405]|uniref:GNAT family N-acetyltransferase n=1 Tax=Streptomyces sp. NPDC000405 TaxID=3161033 RepID=UPI00398C8E56